MSPSLTTSAAFEALRDEVDARLAQFHTAISEASSRHDYETVGQLAKAGQEVAGLKDELAALERRFGALVEADLESPYVGTSSQALRAACLERVEKRLKSELIMKTETSYVSTDGKLAVVCAVSKEYRHTEPPRYWLSFHPYHLEFLEAAAQGYVVLGCGTPEQTLLIPFTIFREWLDSLNTTKEKDRYYWHIHVLKRGDRLTLDRKKGFEDVDLMEYLLR